MNQDEKSETVKWCDRALVLFVGLFTIGMIIFIGDLIVDFDAPMDAGTGERMAIFMIITGSFLLLFFCSSQNFAGMVREFLSDRRSRSELVEQLRTAEDTLFDTRIELSAMRRSNDALTKLHNSELEAKKALEAKYESLERWTDRSEEQLVDGYGSEVGDGFVGEWGGYWDK